MMGFFTPAKKKYESNTEKIFECTECGSEYDTREEAEQCCADSENDDNEEKEIYIIYSSDKKIALLLKSEIYSNAGSIIDWDDVENSAVHMYLKTVEELVNNGYEFVRTVPMESDAKCELYKLRG